nr:hypothetical protein [Tanacetum cinerariifolium]
METDAEMEATLMEEVAAGETCTWLKLENELWNLTVKGTDVVGYIQSFQELALLCPKMVLDEEEKIKRFKLHHTGSCIAKCGNCNRVGHITKDCWTPVAATNQRALVANQKNTVTCYEYGKQGHYLSECSKLKNQNRGNQAGNGEALGRVFDLGGGEANQDANDGTDNVND